MTKEEFEALINRYLSGQASEREEQIIEEFFTVQERRNPADTGALSDSMWAAVERGINRTDLRADTFAAGEPRKHSSRQVIWRSLAAALVLGVALSYGFMNDLFSPTQKARPWVTLDTPYGQKSIVTLPDGTRIFLNGGSVIRYPEVFHKDKREVQLSGEAFFEVAPNPERPFIVTSGEVVTQVLGTSFNVQAFPEKQISVTVATGKVFVDLHPAPNSNASNHGVVLAPNGQAVYRPGAAGFTVSEVDIEKYVAWKDNTLVFKDISLEQVAVILERWYNVTIDFDNALIRSCRINGKYKDQSLESVLQSIQYMYHIDFDFSQPNRIRLKGDGCRKPLMNSS